MILTGFLRREFKGFELEMDCLAAPSFIYITLAIRVVISTQDVGLELTGKAHELSRVKLMRND